MRREDKRRVPPRLNVKLPPDYHLEAVSLPLPLEKV